MSVDTTTLGPNSIIRNTVTNRNTIAPVLYSICVNNNAPIAFTEDGEEHELNSTDVYQAICIQNGQPVTSSATGSTGYVAICVGPDTPEKALEWMTHLNLLEADPTRLVLMQFYVSGGGIASDDVLLANTVGPVSYDHIEIQLDGVVLSAAGSQILFSGGSCVGSRAMVEVSCASNTAGSEKVIFNVLSGANGGSCSEEIIV